MGWEWEATASLGELRARMGELADECERGARWLDAAAGLVDADETRALASRKAGNAAGARWYAGYLRGQAARPETGDAAREAAATVVRHAEMVAEAALAGGVLIASSDVLSDREADTMAGLLQAGVLEHLEVRAGARPYVSLAVPAGAAR